MKIAVWHNLPSGGGKRALYYHVRGLVARGHTIESWCLETADRAYLPLSEFAPEHIRPYDFKPRKRNHWLAGSFREVLARMQAFDEACRQCAKEIEAGGFDLLFANSALDYHVPYVMQHVRIPKVLYLQEPCRYLYEASPILPWVAADGQQLVKANPFRPREALSDYARSQTLRALAKQEWLNARACDLILVNSYFSRESMARAFAVDAKVCYLGIDTSLFQNRGLERERFIVGLGSFDSIKRVDLAVKALALLSEPRPPLEWIANSGNEKYLSEVKELAAALGVDLRIRMAISDEELVATLNKAALLVYTSRLEPFGFAPLEANACGLPVVGVAEGGIRETIQNGVNGFLVDPEPASIARAVNQLLQDSGLAKQMGDNAELHVRQKWGVEQSIDRLEQFLTQALSSGSQGKAAAGGYRSGQETTFTDSVSTGLLSDQRKAAERPKAMCTIIAKNYLAFARTLAQSFLSLHPDHKCYVLIVDDFEGFINPTDECFEIIKLADLEIPNLPNLRFKYDVKELCTAVKARLLEYLIHEKDLAGLMYLDPDILVTGRLDHIYERLATHDIVLTPHLDTDFPADGLLPDDGHILRAGLFNLGFIAINDSENAASFLDWWKAKLYEKCYVDLLNGYFVDQKFIDVVPLFFSNVFVEKGVGYNVAYWNLHSRQLSCENGKWQCNGDPLYFFHFSGYSPKSKAISQYIPLKSRFGFANRPDLQPLFSEYERLLIANGHDRAKNWSYTYDFFQSGAPLPKELRVYFRNTQSAWDRYGDPFASSELARMVGDSDLNISRIAASSPTAVDSASEALAAELMAKELRLNAILNSRAWRWVNRYGHFKNRFLQPSYNLFGRAVGAQRSAAQQLNNTKSEGNGNTVRTESRRSVQPGTVCFCTLAIHAPYRRRARLLCGDAANVPWIVLTDEPDEFADLQVRAIHHTPTGPMAVDYLEQLPPTGEERGAAAYHDKRFALLAALENSDTAIYVDADSRIRALPALGGFPSGIAVLPIVRKSIAEHLSTSGSWRMPVFQELARELTGDTDILLHARWCHETVVAITRDGRESRFFAAWSLAANFLQERGVFSGEGGVIGLAAASAGWSVNYEALASLAAAIQHEGGGPKEA